MAKVGLREQNRLSGANRNTLIAGGIMANTAEIFNFPVPDVAQKERRVADLDDGYTRIANELLESSHGFDVWGNKCDSPTVALSPARVTDVYS